MYIPAHFLQQDTEKLVQFMRTYSFATLVSQHEGRPFATHIPVITEQRDTGLVLCTHISKANPQWHSMGEQEVLVMFMEPHAYISPRHYEKTENVPTWNYVAVHAYGRVRWIEQEADVLQLLEKTVANYEEAYLQQWHSLDMVYKKRMARGICAFEIVVNELQGKDKLSQNKTETERQHIIRALEKSPFEHERAIAGRMKQ